MKNKEKFQEWIINWFSKNTDIKSTIIKKNLLSNYMEIGWIDSFKFISFITEIEDTFQIKFSNDEFQNRKFVTVSGLAEILSDKSNV